MIHSRRAHQRRQRVCDEDFFLLKKQMDKLKHDYSLSDDQKKAEIRTELSAAIDLCKVHMGGLQYNYGMDVNRRFVTFYTPRLKLLEEVYSSLQ